jgi:signal transduction histidine kinase
MVVRRTQSCALDSPEIADKCGARVRVALISKVLILIFYVLLSARTEAQGTPTIMYRTAASVLSLPYDMAVKGGYAKLKGTITLSTPVGVVLQDHTGGIWVDCCSKLKTPLVIGDVVTVVGTVGPGAYSPEIERVTVSLDGHGPLPRPRNVSFVQLSSGEEDAQYVAIEGIIRTVTLRNDALNAAPTEGALLTIDMPEGRVDVALPTQCYKGASDLIGAKVRITATALARKNDDSQATGVLLVAPDISYLTVLSAGPDDLFSARMVPIGALLRYRSDTDYFHRIRLQGTLTYYEQGRRLILQDGSRAIEVFPADSQSLRIGDLVEAVGFPTPDAAGPVLRDAVTRRLSQGPPLEPVTITLREALASRYRSCLVSLHLRLVRVISEPTRTLLLLESGHDLTTAELDANIVVPTWLRPGSDLRLVGIDMLNVEGGIGYLNYRDTTVHSVLLLQSLNDVSLISPATWWSQTRLLSLIIVLAILLTSFLVLLMYVQLKRWKVESTLHERERLARDVHDTLAQSFAGVGFQLQVIRRAITNGDENLLHHVDTARDLVQFSHREARRSLVPSISEESVGSDLLSSLNEKAQALVKNGLIKIEAHSTGSVRAIPGDVKMQLFRIGQEAIANAIRHADPAQLAINVEYGDSLVRLTVIDDGRGFLIRGDLLGFGIRGMRKRASEINADFDLVSVPGVGTTIAVSVPIRKRMNPLVRFNPANTFRKSIGEI